MLDKLRSLAGYRAYRCRDCRRRFHLLTESATAVPATIKTRAESRKRRKALKRREMLVYAAALMAFAITIFIITQERG